MDQDQIIKFLSRTLPYNLRSEPELGAIKRWLKTQKMFNGLLKFICLFICISFFAVIVVSIVVAHSHSAPISVRDFVVVSIAILISALNYYFLWTRGKKLRLSDDDIKIYIKTTK